MIDRVTTTTRIGDNAYFTGTVYVDEIQSPGEQVRYSAGHVRFSPGARTAWHTHPRGQTLYVTDGVGRVQRRGSEELQIHAGDVVYIAPNEEHWHEASPIQFMAHVAIAEADEDGRVVTWGAHVSDEEYSGHL